MRMLRDLLGFAFGLLMLIAFLMLPVTVVLMILGEVSGFGGVLAVGGLLTGGVLAGKTANILLD